MITEQYARDVISHYSEELLRNANRYEIKMKREWAAQFPADSGIYAVFLENEIVYIGETGKLRGRLRDLIDTRNHTLRRNLGKGLFSNLEGYQDASTKKKFPEHIEKKVNNCLEAMKIAVLPIFLGRTEVEEFLIEKYKPIFNTKAKRK